MKLYSQPQTINGPFLVHKRYSIYCLVGADGHALLVVARGGVVRVDDGVGGHTVGVVGLGPGVDGVDVGVGVEEEGEHFCTRGIRVSGLHERSRSTGRDGATRAGMRSQPTLCCA